MSTTSTENNEELTNHVIRLTGLIMDDHQLRLSSEYYARRKLVDWGFKIPDDVTGYEPYWTLVTEYLNTVVSRVSHQCSSNTIT